MSLTSTVTFYYEGTLKLYSAIVQLLLERSVPDEHIVKLQAKESNVRHGSMTLAEFAQEIWTKILSCGLVYEENLYKDLFVERATHPISRSLRRWCAEDQHTFLEDLEQRTESLLDLQG